jgi:hypothetical protein
MHKNRLSRGRMKQINLIDISFVQITHTHTLYIKNFKKKKEIIIAQVI